MDKYISVGALIQTGKITRFKEIFQNGHIAPSTLCKDLHLGYYFLLKKIEDSSLFTFKDIIGMAKLMDISADKLIDMAYKQIVEDAQSPKRKKGK